MTSTTNYTEGEPVEFLGYTDDPSRWERAWRPATYVGQYQGDPARGIGHVVNHAHGEVAVFDGEIRKVTR